MQQQRQQYYYGGESIYRLIPPAAEQRSRPAMHQSKYPHDTPPTASTFGAQTAAQTFATNLAGEYQDPVRAHPHLKTGGTLGPKKSHQSDATNFLTKGSHRTTLPDPQPFRYNDATRKPPVVTAAAAAAATTGTTSPPSDGGASGDGTSSSSAAASSTSGSTAASTGSTRRKKNFIAENALTVITAEAKKPPNRDIRYTAKADFGKAPEYLQKVKAEISAEKDYIRRVVARQREEQMRSQPKMKLLPEDERQRLLANLKSKWETVNKQYQEMTHIVSLDTIGKVRRKEQYETELQQLEKSIERLSKQYVFVHDDQFAYY